MTTEQIAACLDLARRHLQARRLADVVQVCRQVLAEAPGQQEARRLWATAAYLGGDLAAARQLLEQAIASGPPSADCLDNLSFVLLAQGLPRDSEQAARQALGIDPTYVEALNNLGNALQVQKRPAEAVDAYQRALALRPGFAAAEKNLADALSQLGRWAEAEAACRRALAIRPGYPGALAALGVALRRQGRWAEAEAALRAAIEAGGATPLALGNLATTLAALGRQAEAEQAIAQALSIGQSPPAHFSLLGVLLLEQKWFAHAVGAFQRALALQPDLAEALVGLIYALHQLGRRGEAEAACQRALAVAPSDPSVHLARGVLLQDRRRYAEAEDSYRRALLFDPNDALALSNLAAVLLSQNLPDHAQAAARQALAIDPNLVDARLNLGAALCFCGPLSEACAVLEEAERLDPDSPEVQLNLGAVRQAAGLLDEAESHFRRALGGSNAVRAHSNAISCRQYRPGVTPAELAELHAEWNRRHAAPLRAQWQPWSNPRQPDRTLRVGFVSPNFAGHPVGYFLVGVLEALDRRQFQVVCYNETLGPDAMTERIRHAADSWRDVLQWTDEELAETVRRDQIDILVDLAGHTEGGRLLVFARKPAPIQVAWIGYPGTTGLEAIDYLVADRQQVPESDERYYRERVLPIDGGYVAYTPPAEAPPVGPLPAAGNGRPTFGCFNNAMKLNPPLVHVWAEILRRQPDARLLLKYGRLNDPLVEGRLRGLFTAEGIDGSRLEFLGNTSRAEHLAAYGSVDLALDPFPYSGGVTTCEALWMGVPVITCPGATFAGRHSLSHLTAAGLTEFVARDHDHYVDLAVELSTNLARLGALRAELRSRVAASPLCDSRRMAEQLSRHLVEAWRRWCDNQPGSPGDSP